MPDVALIAERAVLAGVLYDPALFPEVADVLAADAFGTIDHRAIYAAMASCHARGQRPDLIAVSDELGTQGRADLGVEAASILATVEWPAPLHAVEHAHRVAHHARRRAVSDRATRLVQRLHAEPDADPITLAHEALTDVTTLAAGDAGPRLYADVIEEVQGRLTLQAAGAWEERLFVTGFHGLDRQLGGGFRPGELVVLGGRPGSGKTAITLQLAHQAARRKEPVLFFSGEMPWRALLDRGLAEMSGIPLGDLRRRIIPPQQYDALMRVSEAMARMPVAIDDTPGLTTAQMLVRAQRFQRQHGLAAVFFDHLELAGDESRQGDTQRLGAISRACKRAALVLDVPFVALSQLSRKVEERTPPIPRMSDLRQSGGIEADADIVLLIYRHDYYVGLGQVAYDPAKAGIADLIVSKQRNGPPGQISVRFDESSMRFTDLDAPTLTRKAS